MLPVVAGPQETRRQILIYSILLVPLAVVPYFVGLAGLTYLALSVVLGAVFLALAIRVYFTTEGREADTAARRLFLFSIFYLYGLFATLFVEALLNRLMA
jgi:protoheme IX farnesyltransferase